MFSNVFQVFHVTDGKSTIHGASGWIVQWSDRAFDKCRRAHEKVPREREKKKRCSNQPSVRFKVRQPKLRIGDFVRIFDVPSFNWDKKN